MPYELPGDWPEKYEKMIWKIIRNKFQGYRDENDLLQEGYLAIINAAEKFDVDKNMKFSSYAYQLIYWRLIRFTKNNQLNFSQLPPPNGKHQITTNPLTLVGFSRLTDDEQTVILLKLDGNSFTKIGEYFGMNRESARNFHKKSVEQLKEELL